jgi:AmiR/NasT family two-component response regulator
MSAGDGQAGDTGDRAGDLYRRAERAKQHSYVLMAQALRLSHEFERAATPMTPKQVLERSPHARLLARLQTMPVIEQAKGVIIAQSHCAEAEAFDMLRRASQRCNVPVRELAARIVASTRGAAAPDAEPAQR